MSIPNLDTKTLAERRRRLAEALPQGAFLFASGRASPRNYTDNTFDFRAGSHFLYLVGLPLEASYLVLQDGAFTLFTAAPSRGELLWHGPMPTLAERSEFLGLEVRDVAELEQVVRKSPGIRTLPTPDALGNADLSALLGRTIRADVLGEADRPLAEAMIALRLIHDAASIAELRIGSRTTHEVHVAGMAASAPGRTEAQVRAAMEAVALAHDVPLGYHPIVTVHGEVLHNHHHRNVLAEGDLLLADVGAESPGGWATDVTRTWPVNGRFSPTQRELYELVLASQKAAIDRCRPGVRYRDVHLTAARVLAQGLVDLGVLKGSVDGLVEDGVVALLFPHGIGHLMGLDVHDMEDLGDLAGYAPGRTRSSQFGLNHLRLDRDLQAGMVVTIEPGLYLVPPILSDPELSRIGEGRLDREALARFSDVRGIRIEDDVLVTDGAPDVLTASIPKEAAEVEALVGTAVR
ncbi:MAG TPA: aminopeptidase P family protein [Myxococcaceae bacterium]|nr:aminopeptidase P family protein [Myxococcaceae bacterium]